MPRVFISHAGIDKPVIEPLVRALLLSKGITLFVDNPGDERWGFMAKETAAFEREGSLDMIREGQPYDDELKRGLRNCDVILLCLSKNVSQLKSIIISEITRAADGGWLVPVIVDDVERDEIPQNLGLFRAQYAQSRRLKTDTVLSAVQNKQDERSLNEDEKKQLRLFEFVLKAIDDASTVSPPLPPVSRGTKLSELPISVSDLEAQTFRAGRMPQREDVDRAFDAVGRGGVQALAIGGPLNELVDQFAENIVACRTTREIRGATHCHEIEVRLPQPKHSATWNDFKQEYGIALADVLKMPETTPSSIDEIARELAKDGIIVLCRTQPFTWQRISERRKQVEFWLQYWREIAESPARPKVVTLLRTSLPVAKPGASQNSATKAFIKWMKELERKAQGNAGVFGFSAPQLAPLAVPDLLNPIEWGEGREWAGQVYPKLSELNKLDAVTGRIYDTNETRENGVTMEDFHKKAPQAICDEFST